MFRTCSVPFSGSGCVAHGTHLSQMEKICSPDFPAVHTAHTRVLDTPVAAEHLALSLAGASIPKGKRRAEAGAAVPVCQHAEDAACSVPSSHQHCHPALNTPSLNHEKVPLWGLRGGHKALQPTKDRGQPCCGVGLGMSEALDVQGMKQSQALVHCTPNQLCCFVSRMAVVTLAIKK